MDPSQSPPPWLEWSDIVLSIIAFGFAVVSLPTAFQMWWGKSYPSVEFRSRRIDPGTGLEIIITNRPIKNTFLKRMGVYRETIHGLSASATITEHGTGRLVGELPLKINIVKGEAAFLVDLHAGMMAWAVPIFHGGTSSMASLPPEEGTEPKLQPGRYECQLELSWSRGVFRTRRTFTAGNHTDRTFWRRPTDE